MGTHSYSLRAFALTAASLAIACGAHDTSTDSTSAFRATLAGDVATSVASIPMPVRVVQGQIVVDGSGNPVPQWDATTVDLVAADAWAQCAAAIDSGADEALDPYTGYLATRIQSASCPVADPPAGSPLTVVGCTPQYCSTVKQWARQRQTLACNVDPDNRQKTVVHFYSNVDSTSGAILRPKVPDPETFTDVDARSAEILVGAVKQTQGQIDVANVNLCMAQRMREAIASSDSLLLSADDQRQVLEVIRERAQLAMVRYAQLGRGLSNPNATVARIEREQEIFPILSSWGKRTPADPVLATMGQNFGAAVKLHVDVTEEEAQLLMRSSSARLPRGGRPQSTAETDWGAASWRHRLLALLYGGNPLDGDGRAEVDLTDPNALARAQVNDSVPWDARWVYPSSWEWPNWTPPQTASRYYVRTDASDPRVHLLLGLARSADAILLKERSADFKRTASDGTLVWAPFRRVDIDPSSEQLYRGVDAWIWTQDCRHAGNPNCVVKTNDPRIPPVSQFEQSLLFKRHGVTPANARTLVSVLADASSRYQLPDIIGGYWAVSGQGDPSRMQEVEGALHITGKHETLTGSALEARVPGATGAWYHLDKNFQVQERSLAERATPHTSTNRFWAPVAFEQAAADADEGMAWRVPNGFYQISSLGAMSALFLTRQLIDVSLSSAPAVLKESFLASAPAAIGVIDGGIGPSGVSIRPNLTRTLVACSLANGCPKPMQTANAQASQLSWDIAVRVPAGDPMYASGDVKLVAVKSQGLEATAVLDPAFVSIGGKSRNDYLVNGALATASASSMVSVSGGSEYTYTISLPGIDPQQENPNRTPYRFFSFFLKTTISGQDYYRLLAFNTPLEARCGLISVPGGGQQFLCLPWEGQYLSYGGALGNMATEAWTTDGINWSKPAYDGFGFRTDWVPPVDPSLYATSSAPNAIAYYLTSARAAADDATNAVKAAVEQLLREQADEATLLTAQKRAQEIDSLEQRSLCGDANPNCDTRVVAVDTADLRFQLERGCEGAKTMCKATKDRGNEVIPATLFLLKAVADHRTDTAPPAFTEYAGGALQRVLIAQWSAYKKFQESLVEAASAAKSRDLSVDAAHTQVAAANETSRVECSQEAMNEADDAAFQYEEQGSCRDIKVSDDMRPLPRCDGSKRMSYSRAGLLAQVKACLQAERSLPPTLANYASVIQEGWAWYGTMSTSIIEMASALDLATADALRTVQESELAKARAQLESTLAIDNLPTRFGTARRYHSLDMWRAQALLESARRYAVTARRAIEARYVVDLSQLRTDESFVAAPATWADDVYQYDLNAPAAVGLSSPSNSGSNAIYANALTDYVQNLTRFVDGYAVRRPTASVSSDAEVLTFTGPDALESVTVNGQPVSILAHGARAWDFYCSNTSTWITHPAASQMPATASIMTACGGSAPSRARLTFSLDPWGRVNGDVASAPYRARHNVRWKRLAANFVGGSVLDCRFAADYNACASNPYIPYDLTMTGPAWVTDFDQQWRLLQVPGGHIEAGKALADNWFDPVLNGWGKPNATAVGRAEFDQEPLGASYALELDVPPQVRLDRLQYVQLLTETAYWVKQ